MSPADQQHGRALTASQREWLRVREYLGQYRYELGQAAARMYPGMLRVDGSVLFSRPEWLPAEPIPLDSVDLEFAPCKPFTGLTGTDPAPLPMTPGRWPLE